MKKKIVKILKIILLLIYIILTGTTIIMMFLSYLFSPFDMNHEARFGELAIGGDLFGLAWLAFIHNFIKNIFVAWIARYFNKRLMILSLALAFACLLNFIGMCLLP